MCFYQLYLLSLSVTALPTRCRRQKFFCISYNGFKKFLPSKVVLTVISICDNGSRDPPYLLFFSHGTSGENLSGNLFHLSFAGIFSFIIIIMATTPDLRSQCKKIIYNVYKFFKELVALKPDGKIRDIFAKIQKTTADACKYSL